MKRVCLVCLLFVASAAAAQVKQVKIDPSRVFQTIDNFAAADAWSGNFVGKYWGEREKAQISEWLFSSGYDGGGNPKGIGLSLWRVNLGAGSWEQDNPDIMPLQRRAESFKTIDGEHYDWGKCAGQRYFMEKAKELGCNNFLLFSNSPLVQYTLNSKGYAPTDNNANIKPECYDLYGDYLAEVTGHFVKNGFNISYVSPINEPQVNWNRTTQEGSPWRKSEMKKMFVSLDKALSARPSLSGVKILVGECASVPVLYAEDASLTKRFGGSGDAPHMIAQALFDKNSPNYIGDLKHVPALVCGHSYHNHLKNKEMVEVRAKVKDECAKYGIAYQQTEWCMLPSYLPPMDGFTADWARGNRGDIQVGLLMGRLIYTDFVHAGSEAWGYWKGMELNGNHALVALHAQNSNIFEGGTVSANKILWALGNYSFFIRPGYKRIELSGADDPDTLVASAYVSGDGSRIVAVFVNSAFVDQEVVLSGPKKVKGVSVYRTDERTDLARVYTSAKSPEKYLIPARSLVTVVLDM